MRNDILKKQRKAKRLHQHELAKYLGVSRELFGKYENGKASPRVELLEAWCNYLDLQVIIIHKQ